MFAPQASRRSDFRRGNDAVRKTCLRRASPGPTDGGDTAASCSRRRAWAALQEISAAASLARRCATRRTCRRRDLGLAPC